MKKYIEILEEIKKARADIINTARTEKELSYEIARNAYRSGDIEKAEHEKEKYKALEQQYIKETEKNNDIKIKIEILKDNAAQAFFAENIGNICSVWNKYAGKPHGEKTAEKIRDELKKTIGEYVSIGSQYGEASITIYFGYCGDYSAPFNKLEFYPIWSGEKYPALTPDNKIIELNPEKFRISNCGEYVENVGEHIKALKEAHKAAQAAEKAFADSVNAYNSLTRGNIARASTREGVKNWLI